MVCDHPRVEKITGQVIYPRNSRLVFRTDSGVGFSPDAAGESLSDNIGYSATNFDRLG